MEIRSRGERYSPQQLTGTGIHRNHRRARLLVLAFLLLMLMQPWQLQAQPDQDSTETEWEEVDVAEADFAPIPGGFGLFGGPTFEFTTLKTTDLDGDLDQTLFLKGGYGYFILSHWIIGGGGTGVEILDPNSAYDRFSFGYSGLLTGYDFQIAGNFTGRATLLVGGGDIQMIKNRPDLSVTDPDGTSEFLERYREEDFFVLRGGASIGYMLGFVDIRATGNYLFPIGGEQVDDLRQFTFGIELMFGFRNDLM